MAGEVPAFITFKTGKMSKQLTELPAPPPGCSDREAAQFNRIARQMLERGDLYADNIEMIADLASVTVWKKNIDRKRSRLIEILSIKDEIDPDFKLNTPAGFAARVDSYLGKADTVEEAYAMAEEDHKDLFSERKYKSYDSYRMARRYHEKKI